MIREQEEDVPGVEAGEHPEVVEEEAPEEEEEM